MNIHDLQQLENYCEMCKCNELEVTVQSVSMVAVSVHAVNPMEQLGHSLCSIKSAVQCSFSLHYVFSTYCGGGVHKRT